MEVHEIAALQRRARSAERLATLDPRECPGRRFTGQERLVRLDAEDDVKPPILRAAGDLRDPIGTTSMTRIGEHCFNGESGYGVNHPAVVCRHHDAVRHMECERSTGDPSNQGLAGKET